jgi:rhomboid protease GluP
VPTPPTPDPAPELAPLVRYPEVGDAFEEMLVVLAMGLECQVDEDPEGGFTLLVHPDRAASVLRELDCYRDEQALPPPPPPPPTRDHGNGALLTALWVLALGWSFWMQDQDPTWTARGVTSPQGIFADGEWWRPFTSLFLHADVGHLMGNLAFGVFFGTWVCRAIGMFRAWFLILLAGSLGNQLNALIRQGENFSSLGASTAVFGALGLLTGIAIFQSVRDHSRRGRFRHLIPLAGGLAMFSMWGAGPDPRIDVSGHVCGLLTGLALGSLAAWQESLDAPRESGIRES